MEKRIKSYEQYLKTAEKHPTRELLTYHQYMVANFQHERLVHLIIMLFFLALTILALSAVIFLAATTKIQNWLDLLPSAAVAALLTIMSIAYVRHYYFLENHIQKLYDATRHIAEGLKR